MRTWTVVAAVAAPVVLAGGSVLAESEQPSAYSAVHNSISQLAAHGAAQRWVMTATLALVGACYVVTAIGMTEANLAGRGLLILGGAATSVVAALPQPNPAHVPVPGIVFVALTLWPAAGELPTPRVSLGATIVLVLLLGWFTVELGGRWFGITERFLAGAQALCPIPFVVVRGHRNRSTQERQRGPSPTPGFSENKTLQVVAPRPRPEQGGPREPPRPGPPDPERAVTVRSAAGGLKSTAAGAPVCGRRRARLGVATADVAGDVRVQPVS